MLERHLDPAVQLRADDQLVWASARQVTTRITRRDKYKQEDQAQDSEQRYHLLIFLTSISARHWGQVAMMYPGNFYQKPIMACLGNRIWFIYRVPSWLDIVSILKEVSTVGSCMLRFVGPIVLPDMFGGSLPIPSTCSACDSWDWLPIMPIAL